MILSSAKRRCEICGPCGQAATPLSEPIDVACLRRDESPSAQNKKRNREIGSPCLKPRESMMWPRGLPFNLTEYVTVVTYYIISLTSSSLVLEWLFNYNTSVVELYLFGNQFQDMIPNAFSKIKSLTHLYLDDNEFEGGIPKSFSGSIPKCLNNLTALTQKTSPTSTISVSCYGSCSPFLGNYDYHAFWMWKGREFEYKNNLGQIKSIYLSSNKLIGPIPREIMELVGLISLNLSKNLLTGRITSEIVMLQSLEVSDLSKNQLCGGIPLSISLISSLNFLVLSNNNLSSIIPTKPQLSTFDAFAYEGNSNLCGFPLPKKCSREETTENSTVSREGEHAGIQEDEDGFITLGFYVSLSLRFIIGYWGVFATILQNKS
ncbi:hypothetical protein RGQ29_001096 [Quercus rubra]|uniref:Uncharacterized protein n=1 Tax=Quercus rubra TaxID=3512 RepID=A0AAN7JDX7_QUERU|nr:hypothetical protein RGQ29_001096 [Quercus rubra]